MPLSSSTIADSVSSPENKLPNVDASPTEDSVVERDPDWAIRDDDSVSVNLTNALIPTPDTSFWRIQHFVIMNLIRLVIPSPPHFPATLLASVSWRIDAYVYAVNAVPNEEFEDHGGEVYVVLVHGGVTQPAWKGNNLSATFEIYCSSGNGAAVAQLPTQPGSYNNGVWNHPFKFEQNMQMFKNGGSETFTFPAMYQDTLNLTHAKQHGSVQGLKSLQWDVTCESSFDESSFPITGISVYRVNGLGTVAFKCTASIYRGHGRQEVGDTFDSLGCALNVSALDLDEGSL